MTEFHIISLGNLCEFVIKNIDEKQTYGTFSACDKHDRKSMQEFVDYVNQLIKENEQLKQQNKMLRTNVGKLTDDVKYLRNLPSTHQKENKQLKQQLFCVTEDEGICLICEHHYLVIKPNDKYFISKCRKEHEECSKEAVRYCEDFELMVKE